MPRDSIEIHLIFACDEGGRDDMIRKIFGPLVMTVVLFAAVLPRAGAMHIVSEDKKAGELSFEAVFSMVPYNEDTSLGHDRIVDIYKTVGEEIPLPGIVFRIYKVATLEQLETGDVSFPEKPSRDDIRRYGVPEALVATLSTDAEGFTTFNFTAGGFPDGIYMVVELPDVSGEVAEPFFLRIPEIAEDGSAERYTVTVRSKNAIESAPDIAVHISELDKVYASFDMFRSHLRILRVSIPIGIANAKKYAVTDTLPPQLTYIRGSPVVKLFTRSGEERQLLWNTHFYLSEGSLSGDEGPRGHFVFALTQRGMSYVATSLGEGSAIPELRIYYEAYIDEDALLGAYIFSQAKVDYVDQYGRGFSAETESAGVCTGGIHLHKSDMEGVPVPGARFKIARVATEEELADPRVKVEKLKIDGKLLEIVFVSFVPGKDLSLPRVDTVTTDENGDASFCGLAHGTYYIVETMAPAGFDLPAEPIEVRIDDISYRTDDELDTTVQVLGAAMDLPQTGDSGMAPFTAIGLSLACFASLMLLLNYRKGRI